MVWEIAGSAAVLFGGLAGATAWQLRRRNLHRWLPSYLRERHRFRLPRLDDEIHVLLCFADHYEPLAHGAEPATARRRVATWAERFPISFGSLRDSDGRPPRWTYFFPAEQYQPEYLDPLAELCRAGLGEVEIHLHHDNDTAESLRQTLLGFKDLLVSRHGLLARDRQSREVKYGFIHGNWALCNCRPGGRLCGVNNEIEILLETGCYADFTYPSAPDVTQPAIINSIYDAGDRPGEIASHEHALPPATARENALLMVQGPLVPAWRKRGWLRLPSIENGCLQGTQPPSLPRFWDWLRARVQLPERPDWFFVKLHAHGAPEYDHEALLGEPMVEFHRELARLAQEHPKFHYHYVTAREMVNLIRAARAGHRGSVAEALDWELVSNVVVA
jgi:hypothetical protein